jgi:hypothetical protein
MYRYRFTKNAKLHYYTLYKYIANSKIFLVNFEMKSQHQVILSYRQSGIGLKMKHCIELIHRNWYGN